MKVLYGEKKEKFLKYAMIIMIVLLIFLFILYFVKNGRQYDDIPELYVKQDGYNVTAKCIKENFINIEKDKSFSAEMINEVWKYDDENTLVIEPEINSKLVFFAKPVGKVKESPKIILEMLYTVETSTNLVSNSKNGNYEFNLVGIKGSSRKSKNCTIIPNLTDNVVYIALVKVKYEHVGEVYYSFKLVNPKNKDIGDKYLEKYIDTYISESERIGHILNLLPYANKIEKFDINTDSIIINYNCIGNDKFIDYNSITLFSLIPLLDNITFNMSDTRILKNRDDYSSYELKYNNIKNIMIKLYGTIEGSNYEN